MKIYGIDLDKPLTAAFIEHLKTEHDLVMIQKSLLKPDHSHLFVVDNKDKGFCLECYKNNDHHFHNHHKAFFTKGYEEWELLSGESKLPIFTKERIIYNIFSSEYTNMDTIKRKTIISPHIITQIPVRTRRVVWYKVYAFVRRVSTPYIIPTIEYDDVYDKPGKHYTEADLLYTFDPQNVLQ